MRSALSRPAGGGPGGTVSVGACPAVPAGDRSAAGIGTMAVSALAPGAFVVVVACDVLAAFDDVAGGEELQAARTSAPAAARAATARARRCEERRDMGRDGSRWPSPGNGTGTGRRRPGRPDPGEGRDREAVPWPVPADGAH